LAHFPLYGGPLTSILRDRSVIPVARNAWGSDVIFITFIGVWCYLLILRMRRGKVSFWEGIRHLAQGTSSYDVDCLSMFDP